jgi:hypothetical protein
MAETVNSSNELLLNSLNTFYSNNEEYKLILKNIINGKHELSLRMIDWLVTRFSKSNNIIYWINDTDDKIYDFLPENDDSILIKNDKFKKINVYLDYRAQLKSFKKFNFDAFRRHKRISFKINDKEDEFIETTIGQLNFFKWAFNNKIINYAIDNQKNIYENMSKFSYKKQNFNNDKNKHSLIPKQDIINTKCYVIFD